MKHPIRSHPIKAEIGISARHLGDYRIECELGRGGMGTVFEAVHVVHRSRVALKTLPVNDGPALHRFKREFRSVAELNHPNLVGLHELASDGTQWFFTMDLVDGSDFVSYVRPNNQPDEKRLREAAAQLVQAVIALHSNHIIHRDLKPSNVMVTRKGQVIVLDFGLVLELDQVTGHKSLAHVAGTPAYMAPEQAACESITGASDWYAVGVMLYESLTGELPFTGKPLKLLQEKMQRDAPAIDEKHHPKELCEFVGRLLSRAPQDRPDSLELSKFFSAGERPDALAVENDHQILVGRNHQLKKLDQAFLEFLESRESVVTFIRGRSGEGKTSLGTAFIEQVQATNSVTVMSGRCYDRESMPFKALDSMIDAICSYLRGIPEVDAALLLPDDIGSLTQAFPVLNRVDVVRRAAKAHLAELSDEQVRARAFAALRELLRRISTRSPILWFIDDLQWGDADSAEVLNDILCPPHAPTIFVVGTYRSDEVTSSPFLTVWNRTHDQRESDLAQFDVDVGPLCESDCVELMVSEFQIETDLIHDRAKEFFRETGGNPFLFVALMNCFDPTTNSLESLQMDEVLRKRLERLPAEAERLLEIAVVSGQAIDLEEATQAAGFESVPMSALTRMRTERLIRLIRSADKLKIDTYHDRIRETLVSKLPPDEEASLHLQLAKTIEKHCQLDADRFVPFLETPFAIESDRPEALQRVYDLAYHFDAGADPRRGWIYAHLAAEQAKRQRSTEVAIQQYEIASRNLGEGMDQAARYRIAEGLGESLMLAARFDDAEKQLDRATEVAQDDDQRHRIQLLLGQLELWRNDLFKAIDVLSRLLRELGWSVPKTNLGFAIGAIKQAFIQLSHTAFPKWHRRSRQAGDRRGKLGSDALNFLSKSYWFQNTPRLFWAHLTAMNYTEQSTDSSGMATAYSYHSIIISVLGLTTRGQIYNRKSLAIYEQLDDRLGVGCTHFFFGISLYASGQYREALERLATAEQILVNTGDPMFLNIGRYHVGLCHWMLGELDVSINKLRDCFNLGVRDDLTTISHFTIDGWAKACEGNLPFKEAKSCLQPIPFDTQCSNQILQAEGQWHLFHKRFDEAVKSFDAAFDLLKQNTLFNWPTSPTVPSLVSALRRQASSTESSDRARALTIRKRAKRLARRYAFASRFFATDRSYALREYAQVSADTGSPKKALRIIDKSIQHARAQDEAYQLALSRLARAEILQMLDSPEWEKEKHLADSDLVKFQELIDQAQPNVLLSPSN